MPNSTIYHVPSVQTVNFLEALAAAAGTTTPPFAASAMNNIPGLQPLGCRRFLIRNIRIVSVQNVGWEVNFFSSALGNGSLIDPSVDRFEGRFGFTSAMGEQIGGAGLWRYYVDGLAISYADRDSMNAVGAGKLHVVMQNIDTVAKSANAAGWVQLVVGLEPVQSW